MSRPAAPDLADQRPHNRKLFNINTEGKGASCPEKFSLLVAPRKALAASGIRRRYRDV